MSVTTIGRWINLPTPSGASDPLRADESLDAGTLQILSSNVTHAARENELGTLFEWAGTDSIYGDLPGSAVENFPWDEGTSSGRVVLFAGVHRVRLYGETSSPPKIRVRLRGLAISPHTLGVIVVAMPAPGLPVPRAGNHVHITTTATSMTTLGGTITLGAEHLGAVALAPVGGTSGGTPDEQGECTQVALYVGLYHTSNSGASKSEAHGLTIYLEPPA
jgi:hypothetical protein